MTFSYDSSVLYTACNQVPNVKTSQCVAILGLGKYLTELSALWRIDVYICTTVAGTCLWYIYWGAPEDNSFFFSRKWSSVIFRSNNDCIRAQNFEQCEENRILYQAKLFLTIIFSFCWNVGKNRRVEKIKLKSLNAIQKTNNSLTHFFVDFVEQ